MSRKTHTSLYFADDKDVYDLLSSSKLRLSSKRLVLIARKRGIILPMEDRDELAKYISLLPFDFAQMSDLVEAVSSKDRDERKSIVDYDGAASTDEMICYLEKLKTERSARFAEVYTIVKLTSERISVEVKYSELDYSKTRLFQRQPREIIIEVEKTPTGFQLRHDATERAKQILDNLAQLMNGTKVREIEIKHLSTAAARTQFFISLIKNIKGFTLENVTTANCSKMPDVNASKGEEFEDGELISEEETQLKESLAAVVRNIKMSGILVHMSPEFKLAQQKGLYVNHIVWVSSEERRKVVFEAGFGDENHEGQFRYDIRGVYERKSDGQYRKTRTSAKLGEKLALLKLIEEGAQKSLEQSKTEPLDGVASVTPASSVSPLALSADGA